MVWNLFWTSNSSFIHKQTFNRFTMVKEIGALNPTSTVINNILIMQLSK